LPARPITSAPMAVACSDVIGKHAAEAVGFVNHVGLAAASYASLVKGDTIDVVEMGPPLREGIRWAPDVYATASLNYDETMRITIFCRQHKGEHEARNLVRGRGQYRGFVITPHCKPFCEADGTQLATRFSCVGFVIEAYREAKIDLVVTDGHRLPSVPWEVLSLAFPVLKRDDWARVNQEYDLGLEPGSSEWHVMLPGYVVNALARGRDEIRSSPFIPQSKDAYFPS